MFRMLSMLFTSCHISNYISSKATLEAWKLFCLCEALQLHCSLCWIYPDSLSIPTHLASIIIRVFAGFREGVRIACSRSPWQALQNIYLHSMNNTYMIYWHSEDHSALEEGSFNQGKWWTFQSPLNVDLQSWRLLATISTQPLFATSRSTTMEMGSLGESARAILQHSLDASLKLLGAVS